MNLSEIFSWIVEIFSWIVEADIRVLLGGVMIIGSIYFMYRLEIMREKPLPQWISTGDKVIDEDESWGQVLKSFFHKMMTLIISIGFFCRRSLFNLCISFKGFVRSLNFMYI